MNRRIFDKDLELIKTLYLSGKSLKQCSKETGFKWTAIRYWIIKLGIMRSISESLKGHIPWSKGKKLHYPVWNKGTIGICKAWHKGKKTGLVPKSVFKKGFVPWNKGLKGYKSGCKNNRWKGGISGEHKTIRESDQYKQWRRDVFVRDQFTCQECGHRFIKIVAHHIKKFSDYPDFRFDVDNGQTLCRSCHCKIHKNDLLESRK